jgi:quinol monooxygenase YgiN
LVDNPRVFFLYEQYVDPAGYEAHMATPHFEKYVRGEAIPNLESRERAFYETI